MPRLTVKGYRGRPWKLCLNDNCPSMVDMREKRAEREAARKRGDDDDASGNGAKPRPRKPKPKPGTARVKPARSRAKR
jgi:hypothetical protein